MKDRGVKEGEASLGEALGGRGGGGGLRVGLGRRWRGRVRLMVGGGGGGGESGRDGVLGAVVRNS